MAKVKPVIKISQSLINDVLYNSANESDTASCPLFLKNRYVKKWETDGSELMLAGRYFEWHLLGATRDMIEPVFPQVNVKDLRPKTADKVEDISKWLEAKGKFVSGGKAAMLEVVKSMPPEFTKGEPGTRQKEINNIIGIAKQILELMGLDVTKGDKQLKLSDGDLEGHVDWLTIDYLNPERKALYDVKYTETKESDRFNGWSDFNERSDALIEKAKTQAAQYTTLYHAIHGEWIPFYFILFGRSGWIKVIKMTMLESGLLDIQTKQQLTRDKVAQLIKSDWKAKPDYNKCMSCPYAAYKLGEETVLCPERAIIPTLSEVQF